MVQNPHSPAYTKLFESRSSRAEDTSSFHINTETNTSRELEVPDYRRNKLLDHLTLTI